MQETIANLNETTGKLLLIKKISAWLENQPDQINKGDLVQYLLINVSGEDGE